MPPRWRQPATVTFSALNETATGTVTAIDLQDTVNNNVVEYGVTVSLADARRTSGSARPPR